jgi:hypothetical protein
MSRRSARSELSRDWERIFSHELGGIIVDINDTGNPTGSKTYIEHNGAVPIAHIEISTAMKGEVGKMAALRHEHGHLELDTFGLKIPEATRLGKELINVIEDIRINLQEGERYQGFRDGYKSAWEKSNFTNKTPRLLYNAAQGTPDNDEEKRIFELAKEVNETEGGHRGETRGREFYEKYRRFLKAVVRYVGKVPPFPDAPGGTKGRVVVSGMGGTASGGSGNGGGKDGKDESKGDGGGKDKDGKDKSGGSGGGGDGDKDKDKGKDGPGCGGTDTVEGKDKQPSGGKGDGKDGNGKGEDRALTLEEERRAKAEATQGAGECGMLFVQHGDIGDGEGGGQGWGYLLTLKTIKPPVDKTVLAMVSERFKRIRISGHRGKEAGIRMNMRIASRAKFTGETKLFKVPAPDEIRNAKFVILQDTSGSMSGGSTTVGGKSLSNKDMAYHFGTAMSEFLKKNGAKVECYRFNDGPFMEGLSLEAGGGTNWSAENLDIMLGWVKSGKQVIILTDGDICIAETESNRNLFRHTLKKPVGMMFGGGATQLEQVDPDWKKYEVGSSPIPAVDNIVKEFARRFRW